MANRKIIEDQRGIVNTFISSWVIETKPKNILHLTYKDSCNAFELPKDLKADIFFLEDDESLVNKKWDFVLGDLWSKRGKPDIGDHDEKFHDVERIESALSFINEQGFGIFCISEKSLKKTKFKKRLNDLGFSISAFIAPPPAFIFNLLFPNIAYDEEKQQKNRNEIPTRKKIVEGKKLLRKWSDSLDINGMKALMFSFFLYETFFIIIRKGFADKQFIAT